MSKFTNVNQVVPLYGVIDGNAQIQWSPPLYTTPNVFTVKSFSFSQSEDVPLNTPIQMIRMSCTDNSSQGIVLSWNPMTHTTVRGSCIFNYISNSSNGANILVEFLQYDVNTATLIPSVVKGTFCMLTQFVRVK